MLIFCQKISETKMKVRCENSHVEVFMRKQVEGKAWNRKLILRVYMQMTNNWVEDFVKK